MQSTLRCCLVDCCTAGGPRDQCGQHIPAQVRTRLAGGAAGAGEDPISEAGHDIGELPSSCRSQVRTRIVARIANPRTSCARPGLCCMHTMVCSQGDPRPLNLGPSPCTLHTHPWTMRPRHACHAVCVCACTCHQPRARSFCYPTGSWGRATVATCTTGAPLRFHVGRLFALRGGGQGAAVQPGIEGEGDAAAVEEGATVSAAAPEDGAHAGSITTGAAPTAATVPAAPEEATSPWRYRMRGR